MDRRNLIFGDLMATLGFVKKKKGENLFQSLARQGREVREARKKALDKAIIKEDK